MLPMLDPGHDLPLGSGIALQLVSDEHTRCAPLLLEELAEQAFGGLLVTPALDENIENEPVLVDGTPEPMFLPGDVDDDLIEVPLVATARGALTNAVGEFPAEFKAPLPDRLVRHRDAAGGQHLLDHAQAQREPKIQPHRVADDFRGVAIASVNRVSSRRRHPARFPEQPGSYQVCSRPNLTVPYYLLCREALNDEAVADWLRDDHVNFGLNSDDLLFGFGCASRTTRLPNFVVAQHASAFMPTIVDGLTGGAQPS